MRMLSIGLLTGVLALGLTGCGTTTGERALSGAGLGAAAGAGTAAMTGGNMTKGAVIGGGLGAAVGAATNRDDIDLGRRRR
ncbi:hypothetical protein LY622_17745 [Halomonas sp. M5N1S17]|uniref:YMGG-like Gly-zipper domain-containing protein n=2 Tax=Halomonadaceae TaxID=28256 RepID=A0A0X8HDC5_9GAMM|nr:MULTISPECIES: hypothetical protein [Halomonas]AMD00541.1 hypothetical protein LOKO_01473 [Halomonas chromatireducens]MBZ0330032.1 hypothetical protein [Halomonas sp. ANAO-440]MCE9665273.1 hypothetical protein [Halomonas alkalisoli]